MSLDKKTGRLKYGKTKIGHVQLHCSF